MRYEARITPVLATLLVGLGVSFGLSLCLGFELINPLQLLSENGATQQLIVTELRLPRALAACAVGAQLAVGGALCQSLFRNPLADPALLGVNAGAMLGAGLAFTLTAIFAVAVSPLLIAAAAGIGGLAAVSMVYRIATRRGVTSVFTMLLAGIAISALVAAINQGLQLLVADHVLRKISLWHLGSLQGMNLYSAGVLAASLMMVGGFALRSRQRLDALLLGEMDAAYLGVNVVQLKRRIILLVSLSVGVCIAAVGPIAFVGLMVPHSMRLIVGPKHSAMLLPTMLAGALLVLLVDTLGRTVAAPAELPVGLLLSGLGAPFFVYLLVKQRHVVAP